jgi:hypothetical protein
MNADQRKRRARLGLLRDLAVIGGAMILVVIVGIISFTVIATIWFGT